MGTGEGLFLKRLPELEPTLGDGLDQRVKPLEPQESTLGHNLHDLRVQDLSLPWVLG